MGNWKSRLRGPKRALSRFLRDLPISSRWLGPPKGWVLDSRAHFPQVVQALTPATQVKTVPPLTLDESPYWLFRDNARYPIDSVSYAEFAGGRYFDGKVIFGDQILEDFTQWVQERYRPGRSAPPHLHLLRMPFCRPLPGLSTVLGDGHVPNYAHWFFFGLGRLAYLTRHRSLGEVDHFIVPGELKGFHWRSLEVLGIPREKVISVTGNKQVRCERLCLTTWGHQYDPVTVRFVRERFLSAVAARPSPVGRRLYISRQRSYGRRITNEAEVLALLRPLGFETVFCEDLSLDDQIAAFRDAEILLSPHGANLTNVIFASPTATVIEMFVHRWASEMTWATANIVGCRYAYLMERGPRETQDIPVWERNDDLTVSLPDLESLLTKLLTGRSAQSA